jgi:predicted RNA binding protein YcfA (HicA-like mRNA interferase family)
MKSVSGKGLALALERHGWTLKRIHGSHHIYTKDESAVRLSVPIHANHPLKQGLLSHLLKQAGLTEQDI